MKTQSATKTWGVRLSDSFDEEMMAVARSHLNCDDRTAAIFASMINRYLYLKGSTPHGFVNQSELTEEVRELLVRYAKAIDNLSVFLESDKWVKFATDTRPDFKFVAVSSRLAQNDFALNPHFHEIAEHNGRKYPNLKPRAFVIDLINILTRHAVAAKMALSDDKLIETNPKTELVSNLWGLWVTERAGPGWPASFECVRQMPSEFVAFLDDVNDRLASQYKLSNSSTALRQLLRDWRRRSSPQARVSSKKRRPQG